MENKYQLVDLGRPRPGMGTFLSAFVTKKNGPPLLVKGDSQAVLDWPSVNSPCFGVIKSYSKHQRKNKYWPIFQISPSIFLKYVIRTKRRRILYRKGAYNNLPSWSKRNHWTFITRSGPFEYPIKRVRKLPTKWLSELNRDPVLELSAAHDFLKEHGFEYAANRLKELLDNKRY